MTRDSKVCIAKFGGAHGVRGEVRLSAFTDDPAKVAAYGPLETADGARRFRIARFRATKHGLIATIDGVTTREQAEQLNGLELFVARERLPATADGEFYHADLIGLAAVTTEQRALGTIVAVHNFGAGDIIEIAAANGPTIMLPFSNAVVPEVDLKGGRIVIELPEEIDGESLKAPNT
jgi:16S rRNA processing protein RimM